MTCRRFAWIAWAIALWPHIAPCAPARDCGTVVLPGGIGVSANSPALSLHPVLLQQGSEAEITGLLYRPLVWINGAGEVDAEGSLAAAITPNADSTSFTVRMKPWHWSDGSEVTADDLLYDWQVIRQAFAMGLYTGGGGVPDLVKRIRRIDDRTVAVDLTRPVNRDWFIKDGLSDFTPLPHLRWQNTPIAEQRNLQTDPAFFDVVDGPMKVAEMVPGRYAAFVPNPRYDGDHPQMRRLVMDFLTGDYPLDALRERQVDAANVPTAMTSRFARLPGFALFTHPPLGATNLMVLNLHDPAAPFLQDVRVREALARAVDQRRLVAIAFHGQAIPAHGVLTTDQLADLPPELRDGRTPLDYDPAAARALLDQAGYHPDASGVRLRFQVIAATGGSSIAMAQVLQEAFAQVGIAMSITTMDFNAMSAKVRGKTGWDAYFVLYGTGGPYPDLGGLWNTGGILGDHDRQLDALIAQATTAQGREGLYAEQRELMMTQPSLFLPALNVTIAVRRELTGLDQAIGFAGDILPERLQLHGAMVCDGAHA